MIRVEEQTKQKNQHKAGSFDFACCLLNVGFYLDLPFNSEDGDAMFFQNLRRLSVTS
jgi:hypothetical protein